MTVPTNYRKPVIIIGAGRSGTNMLRDLLVQMPGRGTWPCDEINYIWRYGNARYPTDELSEVNATRSVRKLVRRSFDNIANKQGIDQVVEKTCANSLRVRFVERIFPDAIYIYIVRDGRDVVASAMKRWTASLDLPYVLRKARYVPSGDVPYYAFRYLRNHINRLNSKEKKLASWGPRYEGMEEDQRTKTLAEVCALQWKRCIERSEEDFTEVSSDRLYRLNYETFVQDPATGLDGIAQFLGVRLSSTKTNDMTRLVTVESVGKWRQSLTIEDQEHIAPIVASVSSYYHNV